MTGEGTAWHDPGQIVFADPRGLADFATMIRRAAVAVPDGAVRLQSMGPVLAITIGVLEGHGILGEGTVLGMRMSSVVPQHDSPLDTTVALASISDRLARTGESGTTLAVPPTEVQPRWASLAPPRDGWEPVSSISVEVVNSVAQQGIQEIAVGAPEGSGSSAVATLRSRVWGRLSETTPPIPAGLAFAAHALGFVGPSDSGVDARVFACGRWTRLSTNRGHVLAR